LSLPSCRLRFIITNGALHRSRVCRLGYPLCPPRLNRTPRVWIIGKQLSPTSRVEREQDAPKSDLRARFLLAGSRWMPVASRALDPTTFQWISLTS